MKGQELTEKAEKETAAAYTPEEKEYLEEYRRELSGIRPAEAGERERLFEAAAAGDGLAKSRSTELYLMTVLGIAEQMHTKEVFLGDLVQEEMSVFCLRWIFWTVRKMRKHFCWMNPSGNGTDDRRTAGTEALRQKDGTTGQSSG